MTAPLFSSWPERIPGHHGPERARLRQLLVGRCGRFGNVIPPLCIGRADADYIADTLDDVLATL